MPAQLMMKITFTAKPGVNYIACIKQIRESVGLGLIEARTAFENGLMCSLAVLPQIVTNLAQANMTRYGSDVAQEGIFSFSVEVAPRPDIPYIMSLNDYDRLQEKS